MAEGTPVSEEDRQQNASSPKNQGFHYHQNAGAYMQIGEAMGKRMVELMKK